MSEERDSPKHNRDFDAYAVRQGKDDKGYFHKIGAAFEHKDGEGYDIDLVATPTNGRVTLRTPKDRLDGMREGDANDRTRGRERGRSRSRE